MHRERKKRQLVIYSLIFVLFLMTIGYAAFQQNFKIKGSTKVTSNWDVRITNVTNGTPEGNAENSKDENNNVILPTWDNLSASMSADLYEAGDSMEYIVTISNRGNLDATLDEVIKTDSSNSAVIITYSGYAEGEKLYKGSSIDIKVKISYNPEYSGGEVTGSSNISFSFKQAESKLDNNNNKPIIENDTVISKDDRTLTYDCTENGGTGGKTAIYDIGDSVDLGVECVKEGYTFLGWNTDKNATTTLNSHTMSNTNTTLYGIYSKTIEVTYTYGPGITSISKNSDTRTIYNKTTSTSFTLPTITLDNDANNNYYELDGCYIEDTKIENPGSNHTYTDSVTVEAKTTALSVMMSGSNFQTTIDSVKSTVTEIEFVNIDEVTPPTINNTTSWDVSAKQNESVIAWLDGTKIYIGGKGGVIGNSDCSSLFNSFTNVTSIEFNDTFDTSNVIKMNGMFVACKELIELDLSSFDTSNVTNMRDMFNMPNDASSKLETIIFGNKWDTSNVTIMESMFNDCVSMVSIDLSRFDITNATNISYMFFRCKKLNQLNLTGFNTSKVTNMSNTFFNCISLRTIYVSENFVMTKVTNSTDMFTNDTNLVGGNGTRFVDKQTTDKTYAKIDKDGQEGYFTDGSVPVIRTVNNVSTTNSITLTVDTWVPNGDEISKIEYSIDGGTTWYEQTNSSITDNIYTFTNLSSNTNYPISIRVTSENNKVGTYEKYKSTTGTTIPTNDLLFWGDAGNPNNTSTVLKNKVSGTDGTMYNFNNTSSSGYNDDELVFDGVDDYVNIGLAGYDFQNSQSYVIYMKSIDNSSVMFGNWEAAGSGLGLSNSKLYYSGYDNSSNRYIEVYGKTINNNDYYTIIGTYDGNNLKLYIDGVLYETSTSFTTLRNSSAPIFIGGNPNGSGNVEDVSNISVKEVLLYDRALTASEVAQITNNFNQKYEGVKTKKLQAPTYEETDDDEITITYPSGCGSTYICSYKVDSGSEVTVNSTSAVVTYTHAGLLTGYVKDKDTSGNALNIASSTYNLTWSDLYVSNSGNDTTGYGTLSAPYATMNKAYQSAKDEATIYVMDDITATETTNFNSNKEITLTSSDSSGNSGSNIISTVTRGSSLTDYVVNETLGELILENITFDGNNVEANSSLIRIEDSFVMNSGTVIENNIDNSDRGGGLHFINADEVIINGGVIKNNKAKAGGGGGIISRYSNLIINGGEITNNSTTYSSGGGIFFGDNMLTINGGTISNNTATTNGGGIYSAGILNMTGGTISNNTANTYGGGITNYGTLTMTSGTITGNTAGTTGGGVNSDRYFSMSGGTISNNTATTNGGGIYMYANTLDITGGEISNNIATDNGGGIYSRGTLSMNAGTISSNNATNEGGGVYGAGNCTINISGGIISNNTTTTGPGGGISDRGILKISGGTISNNTANTHGGGITNYGTLTMTSGTITGNTAGTTGGGVNSDKYFSMSGGTISNNTATTNGGGIYMYANTLDITGGEISNNIATDNGGGIYSRGTLSMSGGTISDNTATNSGGGIYATGTGTVTISGTALISKNKANGSSADDGGGGIKIESGKTLNISDGTISENTTSYVGGGVCSFNSTVTITGGTISENTSSSKGGGVHLWQSAMTMTGGTIENNTSSNIGGGGVAMVGNRTTFTMDGGIIKNNSATSDGGVSKGSDNTFTYNSGVICENTPTNAYETHATCPTS